MLKSYADEYKKKLVTSEQAASFVKSEDVVIYGTYNCTPYSFDKALGERAGDPDLEKIYVKVGGVLPPVPGVIDKDPDQSTFQAISGFYLALNRKLGDKGLMDYLPVNYHDSSLMSEFAYRNHPARMCDVWAGQVTAMDKFGNFNLGICNVDNRQKALNSKMVIVEVNEKIPFCLGGYEECLHISEVDYIIEGENPPLFNMSKAAEPTAAERKIAELIVEDIHDGCCLQLGIGALPDTIGQLIADSDLKDLGIQTEMFNKSMVKLHEVGRVTNAKKAIDRYKTTYTFCLGDQDTYDFLHYNPLTASCPVAYVNAPYRVVNQPNIISINNIVELDLYGQVCSESSGTRHISGVGGQLDWVHGAWDSNGGKSFLAFSSTYSDKQGKMHSRIRPLLTPGSVVTVPRHSVHYVVTEYGKLMLKGLTAWERVEQLVNLAHPDFRDDLLKEAQDLGIWRRTNRKPL